MLELRAAIKNNGKAADIVSLFRTISKSAANDVISAMNGLVDYLPDRDAVRERIDITHVMCTYMTPSVEDTVAMLLHAPLGRGSVDYDTFKRLFRENRVRHYFSRTEDAIGSAGEHGGKTREAQIDYYIMMRVCDRMMDNVIRTLTRKGVSDTLDVFEAYNFAKRAHLGTRRKSGEPYLTHPIAVAAILADVGVDNPIIAAALLHDVVEDTDYTLEDIAEKCGLLVSQYVDAVTSVHKQYEASHNRTEYSYDKSELDAKSFEKLAEIVALEPRMIFALYIKAADRIHNLRTIDKMSSEKKHNKTDETELDYLPLFKKFNLNYFVSIIEDLTWRTNNSEFYDSVRRSYEDIICRNREHIDETYNILHTRLGEEFTHSAMQSGISENGYEVTVNERLYLTNEVYAFVKDKIGADADISSGHVNKKNLPVCDFDIIVDPKDDTPEPMRGFMKNFVKMFNERIAYTGRAITNVYLDKDNRYVVTLEDKYRCMFRLCFSTRDDYYRYRIGGQRGMIFSDSAEEVVSNDNIYVKLRNGKTIALPVGATVIDAAFAIHPEVGFSVRAADINGHAATIYNRLHDGDWIIVHADTYRENGVTKVLVPHVRIGWLSHVVTEKAKKAIIRRLEKQYEGEDPKNEFAASDIAASNVVDMLLKKLKAVPLFEKLNSAAAVGNALEDNGESIDE